MLRTSPLRLALCTITMKVRFKKKLEDQAPSMTIGKEYEVIGVEADAYRIVCDVNEPYLYEPAQFEIVDPAKPEFWVSEFGEDGELYAYPAAWFHDYFFEKYFENESGVVDKFWHEYKRLYGITKNA